MDVSRLHALGWRPAVGLEHGLRVTYDWYLSHRRAGARGGGINDDDRAHHRHHRAGRRLPCRASPARRATSSTASSAARARSTPSASIISTRTRTSPSARFFMHYGDMTDATNLIRIVQETQPDEIYNLAAQSHVQVSFETPEYTANADALGTLRLARGHAHPRPGRQRALLPGLDQRDVRSRPGDPAARDDALLPAQSVRRRQGLRLLDHRQLPRGLRHARLQRHPLQPRKPDPRRDLRDAQDHPRRGAHRARASTPSSTSATSTRCATGVTRATTCAPCTSCCSRTSPTTTSSPPGSSTACASSCSAAFAEVGVALRFEGVGASRRSASSTPSTCRRLSAARRGELAPGRPPEKRTHSGLIDGEGRCYRVGRVRVDPRYFRPPRSRASSATPPRRASGSAGRRPSVRRARPGDGRRRPRRGAPRRAAEAPRLRGQGTPGVVGPAVRGDPSKPTCVSAWPCRCAAALASRRPRAP